MNIICRFFGLYHACQSNKSVLLGIWQALTRFSASQLTALISHDERQVPIRHYACNQTGKFPILVWTQELSASLPENLNPLKIELVLQPLFYITITTLNPKPLQTEAKIKSGRCSVRGFLLYYHVLQITCYKRPSVLTGCILYSLKMTF